MIRRIGVMCLLVMCVLGYSTAQCYQQLPNFPQYTEEYRGGTLTKSALDQIFLITDTKQGFAFESFSVIVSFLYDENNNIFASCIRVMQPNNKSAKHKEHITRHLSSVQILTDFQRLNYNFAHEHEDGLEYVTDYFFTTPSDSYKIYNVFNSPSQNIILRLIDLSKEPHDYFLNPSFAEMIQQATH